MDNSKTGFVTFLDVLGWKGIYQKRKDATALLEGIVSGATEEFYRKYPDFQDYVKIVLISDTILIYSDNEELLKKDIFDNIKRRIATNLMIHGYIIKHILEKGASEKIFFRGATSVGEFQAGENSYVGPAIDEAASWHEECDWMGVVLAPSAQIYSEFVPNEILSKDGFNIRDYWCEYDKIPLKRKSSLKYALRWNLYRTKEDIFEIIQASVPLNPNIADKYLNTLEYMKFLENK